MSRLGSADTDEEATGECMMQEWTYFIGVRPRVGEIAEYLSDNILVVNGSKDSNGTLHHSQAERLQMHRGCV